MSFLRGSPVHVRVQKEGKSVLSTILANVSVGVANSYHNQNVSRFPVIRCDKVSKLR